MNKYKAVYFDRDNTLTYKNKEVYDKYYTLVEGVSNKKFVMDNKRMFEIFNKIKKRGFNTNTYESEVEFYKEYYREILSEECGYIDEKVANDIFTLMWLNDRVLYDDVIETFKEIKKKGLKIGIISDTGLSLENTLVSLGLKEYIDCYVSSKEVGVMKPNPKIYNVALDKLGVRASECIYIDDYDKEVEGAINLGFKGFRINRDNKDKKEFDISSLKEIIKVI